MNERAKITASHLSRQAIVYLRQSSAAQVAHNRESTRAAIRRASKARDLGWPDERVVVIDEDLAFPAPVPWPAPASPGLPPKWRSLVSAWCSVSKSRA